MRKFTFRVINLAADEGRQIVASLEGLKGVKAVRFEAAENQFVVQFEMAQTSALELARFVSGLRGPNKEPYRVEPIGTE